MNLKTQMIAFLTCTVLLLSLAACRADRTQGNPKGLCSAKPLTISMSMYGGFEQVGSLGTSISKDDKQMTAKAGDIVLYSGNQLVVFYGSNSWAYTKLGHITDQDAAEMKELLGNGDVAITISLESI